MSGWRWLLFVPLGLFLMVIAAALALVISVAIPFSIAFHILNDGYR